MNRIISKIVLGILVVGFFWGAGNLELKASVDKPLIQMAILLDTSGSMDGLIEQAKVQLWKMVNELALTKRSGKSPRLEVALYEYGKDSIPASDGYLRRIVPLSSDLDKISEELFKLQTNGGSEYCGRVILSAVKDLAWSPSNQDYKVIFIAGNEPFTQGEVNYKEACKSAVSQGIIVNTIFCGDDREGRETFWKDGADLADGIFITINQNKKNQYISAPQDTEIAQLGSALNQTYLAFGKSGAASKTRQEAQDANAVGAGAEVSIQRSMAKAAPQYSNEEWDLVDAEKKGVVKLDQLKDEELPAEMRNLKPEEKKKYLEKKQKQRDDIQTRIRKLRDERENFLAEKRKEQAGDQTLDTVMINALKEQAGKKKFLFDQK